MNVYLATQATPPAGTAVTRRRYDRIAPAYDLLELGMELRFAGWRRALWAGVAPGRVLEVGVGTGKNLPYHPPDAAVTAIDLSPRMLERAKRRAQRLGSLARLELADVQALPFPDASFDTAVATFVFCSVPDPVLGLRELRRVLKPGGRLLLLDHVLSGRPWLRWLMRRLDPLPYACGAPTSTARRCRTFVPPASRRSRQPTCPATSSSASRPGRRRGSMEARWRRR